MPRWIPPVTITKLFFQNDGTDLVGRFLSTTRTPVRFHPHPNAMTFDHCAEISIIGDVLIWSDHTDSGYVAKWQTTSSQRFEIHFVDAGECRSVTATQDIHACAGQVYLLHDTRQHRVFASPGMRKTSLSMPFSRYAKLASALEADPAGRLRRLEPVIEASTPTARVIRSILRVLNADGEEDNPFSSVPLPSVILKEALLQAFISSWSTSKTGTPYRPAPRKIRRATEWIESNLQQKIMLHNIAEAAGTSPRSLQALFQKQLGMTPMSYVIKLRLHHVHEALMTIDNNQTIHFLARTWGFGNYSDFERYYKDLYGHSPSETRQQAKFQANFR
ncbi:helix-turn-helix domain-containing protein [Agrobacterium cavarae]|uniref:helix-turn-helix domain-containing protein n=1 Tax=Agrobacterium cavarae TaxID=2528239 RepID=UPI003EE4786E